MSKVNVSKIRDSIRKKYRDVSVSACGKFRYPTGIEGLKFLGYDLSILEDMPDSIFESFCGVGNVFKAGRLEKEEAILDVGCGSGFDLIYAYVLTSGDGLFCGIDLTYEMIEKGKSILKLIGISDIHLFVASSEAIPFREDTFDLVISNGVINLSPEKEGSFREIYRIVKKGGRLQLADIVLKEHLPQELSGSLEAWSD